MEKDNQDMNVEEALVTVLGAIMAGRKGGTTALEFCQHLDVVASAIRDACSTPVQSKVNKMIERFRCAPDIEVVQLVRQANGFD